MDVLKPELLYIKGRCYRINPTKENLNDPSVRKTSSETRTYYEDEMCSLDCSEPENEEEQCPTIESISGNQFRMGFHVARSYFGYIIGTKGATRKRLQTETKTQINVPKLGQDGDVVITGNSKGEIITCYRRINLIILTVRKRQQCTHFLSMPFCGDQVKNRFLEFKKEVLLNCKDRGIEENAFISPDKLHMTICAMVLSDDVERTNASQLLKCCKVDVIDKVLNKQPLRVRVQGIEIMNDDPAEVNVLYATLHPEDEDQLTLLADKIANYFAKAGIVDKQYDRVKAHVTLMNTRYSKSSTDLGEETHKQRRNTINATSILKMFGEYDFGEVVIDSIHLSQMGSVSSDGYYKASVVVNVW